MLRTRLAATVVAAAALTAPLVGPADAAPKVRSASPLAAGMTLYATHPMASRTAFDINAPNVVSGGTYCEPLRATDTTRLCPIGQTITDMNVDSAGNLVAGYGDWNYNADSFTVPEGRVAAVPLNLASGTWGVPHLLGTEAFDVVRRAPDGSLWIPMTDPSNHTTTGSGVATNQGGAWRNIADGQHMFHTFDVAVESDGAVWAFGAKTVTGVGQAGVAARSIDGGATWTASLQHRDPMVGDYSRFYSGVVTVDGAVVTGLAQVTGTFTFDGAAWMTNPFQSHTEHPRLLERFADGYVYAKSFTPRYVVGGDERLLTYPAGVDAGAAVTDFYVDPEGVLFYLAGTSVVRVDPVTLESRLIATDVFGTSIVVHGDRIYSGWLSGQIFRSVALDTDGVADEPTTAPAPTKGKGGGRKG